MKCVCRLLLALLLGSVPAPAHAGPAGGGPHQGRKKPHKKKRRRHQDNAPITTSPFRNTSHTYSGPSTAGH